MDKVTEAFKFRHPSNIMIAGPSGSGKTVFTTKLILENQNLWPDTPCVVHYCYGVWQPAFETLKESWSAFPRRHSRRDAIQQVAPQRRRALDHGRSDGGRR